jgi:hypothetical protein
VDYSFRESARAGHNGEIVEIGTGIVQGFENYSEVPISTDAKTLIHYWDGYSAARAMHTCERDGPYLLGLVVWICCPWLPCARAIWVMVK